MANGEFGEPEIDGPARTIVTGRRPATPGRPAVWSACEWVMTSSGISVTPTEVRQRASASGSGPVSTRIADWAPVRISWAPPWPTSQATTVQSPGQPG